MVGLVDGVLPIAQSLSRPEAVEEERRLLYVAVTRAREQLTLSWSLVRNPGAKRPRPRSRFLTGLAPESSAYRPAGPPAGEEAEGRARGRGGGAVRAAARVAQPDRPGGSPCRPTWSSPTRPCRPSPRPGPAASASSPRCPGIGARKLELYGEDVLAALAG